MNRRIKHKHLIGQIIKATSEVHNYLGCGLLEKVYENALCMELVMRGLHFEKAKKAGVRYKGNIVGEHLANILVEGKIMLHLKNVHKIVRAHRAQLLNYLSIFGIDAGLIVNFSKPKLEFYWLVL